MGREGITRDNFTIISNELTRSSSITPTEKAVFIYIASLNPAFPSYEDISRATGRNRNTVGRALASLKRKGMITWVKGRSGKSNLYSIEPVERWRLDTPKKDTVKGHGSPLERIAGIIADFGDSPEALEAVEKILRDTPVRSIYFTDIEQIIRNNEPKDNWGRLISAYTGAFERGI